MAKSKDGKTREQAPALQRMRKQSAGWKSVATPKRTNGRLGSARRLGSGGESAAQAGVGDASSQARQMSGLRWEIS